MTIYAIEHIKDIGSGEMHAQLFRCSDGYSYVVKFISNPLGRKALFNELISFRLGKLLNLPIAEGMVVHFSKNKLKNPDLMEKFKIEEGPHFGSRFLEQASHFNRLQLPLCDNIGIAPEMIVFDYWISNFDRARQPSNLLIVGKQSPSLALIDHADAFRKSNWNITSILSRIDNMEVRWGQVYQEFVPYIDQKQPFQTALEKL
ncbi:HipA family kinase, partial [Bacillus xiapuensis]|nr:hypothetical protein [Bacillus xiapuensis]